MIAVSMKNIEKYYGVHKVLHNVSFEINEGEKVALIGGNGTGKTTILRVLAGESYEGGLYTSKKHLTIGYLQQMPGDLPGLRGMDLLVQGNPEVADLKKRLRTMEQEMASTTDPEKLETLMHRYGSAMERFEALGGYSLETRIHTVTEGLRIPPESLENEFDRLSGGEKTKLLFAQMLIAEPELLLLDEPTNHLDIEAIEWLEEFIRSYSGTVLLVSHDRYFLDKSIQRIIELEDGECQYYEGNYSFYLQEKERRLLIEFENYQDQQKKIKSMEAAIKRLRDWGLRGDNEKFFKRAESMQKALDKMEKLRRPLLEKRSIDLSFDMSGRSGKDVVLCEGIKKSFGEKHLFENGDLHLRFGERVGLLGGNGSGKTTFFRMLMGELSPDEGTVQLGSRVKIGYLPQIIDLEDGTRTVLEEFRNSYRCTEGEARSILARFLFYKDSVFKRVKDLSGGERTRIRLAQLMHEDINLLLLDEPTNHLDLETREVLEAALQEFDGTLLFISHDRYFINKLAERIYSFEDHSICPYPGNYDYYREKASEKVKPELKALPKVENRSAQKAAVTIEPDPKNRSDERPTLSPYTRQQKQKQADEIEALLQQLSEKEATLDSEMSTPEVAADFQQIALLLAEKKALNVQMEELYKTWSDLLAILE